LKEPTIMSAAALLGNPATRPGLRILLAEDEEMLRIALQGLLRLMGHVTDAVRNGREALDAAMVTPYDVVLLDVQMPEMGGYEAATRIRNDLPQRFMPRIVGLSGEPQERDVYASAGMDAFLAKPVRWSDLAGVLGPEVESVDDQN
jgi:CheY-like chemotaxis protein